MGNRYPIRAKAFVEVELERDDLAKALVEEMLKELGKGVGFSSNSADDYYIGDDFGIYKHAHNYGPYNDPDELIGKSEKAASLLLAAHALHRSGSRFDYQWKHVTGKEIETKEVGK